MSETVGIRAVVITLSDSGHAGRREDESGAVLEGLLNELGAEYVERVLLPDEKLLLSEKLMHYADRTPANLILTTGGTGFTSRDVTPEATQDWPSTARRRASPKPCAPPRWRRRPTPCCRAP